MSPPRQQCSPGATNRIQLGWSDARDGVGRKQALLQTSTDRGVSWSSPVAVQSAGDRPDFTAVAISPDGATADAVYDAFHRVYADLSQPRPVQGVVVALNGDLSGPVTELYRGGRRCRARGQLQQLRAPLPRRLQPGDRDQPRGLPDLK